MPRKDAELDRIYARIPKLNCQRKCQECCGPIMCYDAEWERMQSASLRPLKVLQANLTCPALLNGGCVVYSVRPLICRLWGTVRAMACPHGCEPERWLSDREANALMCEIKKLSGGEITGPDFR